MRSKDWLTFNYCRTGKLIFVSFRLVLAQLCFCPKMYQQKGRNKVFQLDVPISSVKEIIKEARSVPFPWDAIPEVPRSWIGAMARAINTQPEFLLLGALTVTSCLMGPDCLFEVRQRHQEPCNIFTACLCEPGTGKTQAYKVAVEDPIQSLPTKVLVHDYTSKICNWPWSVH